MMAVGLESLIEKSMSDDSGAFLRDGTIISSVKSPDKFWVSEDLESIPPHESFVTEIRLAPLIFPAASPVDPAVMMADGAGSPHLASRPPPA